MLCFLPLFCNLLARSWGNSPSPASAFAGQRPVDPAGAVEDAPRLPPLLGRRLRPRPQPPQPLRLDLPYKKAGQRAPARDNL